MISFKDLAKLKKYIREPENINQIYEQLSKRYENYSDPWGLDILKARKSLKYLYPIYKDYFKVRVFGAENVADKPYMVTSNHTGQIAIDGMLLAITFLTDITPPRILRGMVERFMTSLPFVSNFVAEAGAVLGDRKNCQFLIENGESILVFPEGVKGVAKPTDQFYQMKPFTKGFFRMALTSKIDILPVAVVGAEEMYPLVYHSKDLAKMLNLPAFPITPLFPLLGPLGALPLPSPIDIYIGKPYEVPMEIKADAPDHVIEKYVNEIQEQIQEMIEEGLNNRRPFLEKFGLKDKRSLENE